MVLFCCRFYRKYYFPLLLLSLNTGRGSFSSAKRGQSFAGNREALRATTAIEWKHFIEYFEYLMISKKSY